MYHLYKTLHPHLNCHYNQSHLHSRYINFTSHLHFLYIAFCIFMPPLHIFTLCLLCYYITFTHLDTTFTLPLHCFSCLYSPFTLSIYHLYASLHCHLHYITTVIYIRFVWNFYKQIIAYLTLLRALNKTILQ